MSRIRLVQIFLLSALSLVFAYIILGAQFFSFNFNGSKILADSGSKNIFPASVSNSVTLGALNSEYPKKNPDAIDLNIGSESAISYLVSQGEEKIIFAKNEDEKLLIASISKLMSALVIIENYDLSQKITISQSAASLPDKNLQFVSGQHFFANDLLHFMLVRSSNEACQAMAEVMGADKFVDLMNAKAKEIGLNDTIFTNPTGLYENNFSTVKDVAKLAEYVLKNQPSIFEMTTAKNFKLYDTDGILRQDVSNIDELLIDPAFDGRIIGGKTGETPYAKQCFLLVTKTPKENTYLISVVLKTKDRFGDMRKLINWTDVSYNWQ